MRVDKELKKQAEELFSDLGLNLTTAFTSFLKQSVREQGIPFVLSRNVPNDETLQAIKEVQVLKNDPNKKLYSSFKDILEDLGEEDD